MTERPTQTQATEHGHVTRAVEVVLDPSPSQERWLAGYAGSMRVAYNWALELVAAIDVGPRSPKVVADDG